VPFSARWDVESLANVPVQTVRVFAISDLHLDYAENARWLVHLSESDYRSDVLILAGDLSEEHRLLAWGFESFVGRFRRVLYVPGNHELWVSDGAKPSTSLDRFALVCRIAADSGISMTPLEEDSVTVVPLLGWYDYSFGMPNADLLSRWRDFQQCTWPAGKGPPEITDHFLALNEPVLHGRQGTVISFSHFLPRIDVMPAQASDWIYPVLGTVRLEAQVRRLGSAVHVYGHSHVNREIVLNETRYINNAFGYPGEGHIAAKRLRCVYSC
jgi:predicted phosphodiesterase